MAVAGLVLGIVSIVLSFIPCINWSAILPAIVGIVLSSVGLAQSKKTGEGKGMATAGLVLSIIAIVWVPIYILMIMGAIGAAASSALQGM